MQLAELYRSGVTDNEDLGEHARTAATINFDVSFAHEQGLNELFAQVLGHTEFQQQLEAAFANILQRNIQNLVAKSKVAPGQGWTDDYEVAVSISPREANTL